MCGLVAPLDALNALGVENGILIIWRAGMRAYLVKYWLDTYENNDR